eukprot:408165_1
MADYPSCDAEFTYQPLLEVSKKPRMYMADNVFTAQECERLITLARPKLTKANVMDTHGKTKPDVFNFRSAMQTALPNIHEANGIVQLFRSRLANMALMPEENGEPLTVIKYENGDNYGLHFDSDLNVGRLITMLVYLNDIPDEAEGYTTFPWAKRSEDSFYHPGILGFGRDIDVLRLINVEPPIDTVCHEDSDALLVKPKQGRVMFFFNHRPDLKRESYAAMHGGCPVRGDVEKWIALFAIDWFDIVNDQM